MSRRSSRRLSRRVRRIWFTVVGGVGGLVALTAFGIWVDRMRDTDLRDASANVTSERTDQAVPDGAPDLSLREVAAELGILAVHGPGARGRTLPEDTGSGVAWADYDGDGDDDLYLVNFTGPLGAAAESSGANRLYRNDGERFVDRTEHAGVGDLEGFGMGASFADYDEDGDLDLYVTNYGKNRLFENRGDGTFVDSTEELGLGDDLWGIVGAWGDLDRDGRLDLYVTNYVDFEPGTSDRVVASSSPNWESVPFTLNPNAFDPQPNRFYRQQVDGSFEEEGLERGISNPDGRSLAVTIVDTDGDGWLDLYVANDVSPNALYRNLGAEFGDAVFEDIGPSTGTADPRGSMGISVADLPIGDAAPDGLPDLFVSHWVAQENALYQAVRIDGRLEYRDRVRQLRMAEISTDRVGWGTGFLDFDLDGRLDLVVANGSTLEANAEALQPQRSLLLWNAGDRFVDLAPTQSEFAARRVARGLAVSDFDRDGDPDFAISINRGRPLLFQNGLASGASWMAVQIATSSALLFGSRLEHRQRGEAVDVRWQGADASFASNHSADHLLGLGAERSAELLVQLSDGSTTRWLHLPAQARYRLRPSIAGR